MAAFKIFAALFVVCIAQSWCIDQLNVPYSANSSGLRLLMNVASAGRLFGRDKPVAQDETQLTDTRTSGLSRGNPFGCMAHLPETYALIQDFRVMWVKYQEIKETVALLKVKCDTMEDGEAKDKCFTDANQTYSDESSKLVEQLQAILPRVAELAMKFKNCLFQ